MKRYQVLNFIGLLGVLTVNYLANALPLGGRTTGELSNLYPSLITPAGLTFSIWGVIYLLLIVFVVVQAKGLFRAETLAPVFVGRIRGWFFLNCLLNMGWLFAWHFQLIFLSLLVMLSILGTLLIIYERLGIGRRRDVDRRERYWVWPAFSIYLGWITVATIVNVSVLLIDLGWSGWGLTPEAWTILMLIVSAGIGVSILFRRGDLWYDLVLMWAYLGIMLKQMAPPGDYITIAFVALTLLVILFIVNLVFFIRRRAIYLK